MYVWCMCVTRRGLLISVLLAIPLVVKAKDQQHTMCVLVDARVYIN